MRHKKNYNTLKNNGEDMSNYKVFNKGDDHVIVNKVYASDFKKAGWKEKDLSNSNVEKINIKSASKDLLKKNNIDFTTVKASELDKYISDYAKEKGYDKITTQELANTVKRDITHARYYIKGGISENSDEAKAQRALGKSYFDQYKNNYADSYKENFGNASAGKAVDAVKYSNKMNKKEKQASQELADKVWKYVTSNKKSELYSGSAKIDGSITYVNDDGKKTTSDIKYVRWDGAIVTSNNDFIWGDINRILSVDIMGGNNKVPASFAANYPNLNSIQLKKKYEEYLKKNKK